MELRNGQNISVLVATVAAFIVALAALGYVFYLIPGVSVDWYFSYYPFFQRYLNGQTQLYEPGTYGVYNPPWVLPLLTPFMLLPVQASMAVYRLFMFLIIIYCTYRFAASGFWRRASLVLVATSLPVSEALMVGNVDLIVLLGVALAWQGVTTKSPWMLGAGLVLATLKPQLTLLLIVATAVAVRKWQPGLLVKGAILPLVAFLTSFPIVGFDWPLRWLRFARATPPVDIGSVTPLKVLSLFTEVVAGGPLPSPVAVGVVVLGLAITTVLVCREPWSRAVPLSMALAPLAVPYLTSQALALSMVVSWPRLLERRRYVVATLIYLWQFLYLLRIPYGDGMSWLFILHPLVLSGTLLLSRGEAHPSPAV